MRDLTSRSWWDPKNLTTGHANDDVGSMPIGTVDLGGAALAAPLGSPAYTRGTYGEMWQWIGDGGRLISLVVAVRPSVQESAEGARSRLLAETDRIGVPLRDAADGRWPTPEWVDVPGAVAAFKGAVDGTREGVRLHNAVLAATDSVVTYLVHVAVTDTEAGRRLASSLLSSLRLLG